VPSADLTHEFREAQRGRPNKSPTCNVELLRRRMTDDQRARLQAALHDETISSTAICDVVNSWAVCAVTLRPPVVTKHRRGMRGDVSGCACERR
jgi:hypothetical protein